MTARTEAGELVGFVNVAWDVEGHAFLIDTKTRPIHQRQGLGTAVVGRAIAEAEAAGCEWLFVDFEPALAAFYIDACGFRSTPAGLVHLSSRAARAGRSSLLPVPLNIPLAAWRAVPVAGRPVKQRLVRLQAVLAPWPGAVAEARVA